MFLSRAKDSVPSSMLQWWDCILCPWSAGVHCLPLLFPRACTGDTWGAAVKMEFCFLTSSWVFRRTKLSKPMLLFLLRHVYKNWVWDMGRWEWKELNAQSAIWGEEHTEGHRDISMSISPCAAGRGGGIRSEGKPGKVIYDLVLFLITLPWSDWPLIKLISPGQVCSACDSNRWVLSLWPYLQPGLFDCILSSWGEEG